MRNAFILAWLWPFSIEIVWSIGNQQPLAGKYYQLPRRRIVQRVPARSQALHIRLGHPVITPRRHLLVANARRASFPFRQTPVQLKPILQHPLTTRNFRPVQYPVRHYMLPVRHYPQGIVGRIRVPPAIKRTRPAPPRSLVKLSPIRSFIRPRQRYVVAVQHRPFINTGTSRLLPARRLNMRMPVRRVLQPRAQTALSKGRIAIAPGGRRFQLLRRAHQMPSLGRLSRPRLIAMNRLAAPNPQQRHLLIKINPYGRRYFPLSTKKSQEVMAQQRQRVPLFNNKKTMADRIRNAIMWKKYLRAEHNPYANQIARRISSQALRRTPMPQRAPILQARFRPQTPYIRALRPRPLIHGAPLSRQMQASYNTQYSVSGTSSNSGTNSNTVLKGPGHTQTNNHVKVTQNTGVRRFMSQPVPPMTRDYRARVQALRNRQLQSAARAKANAKVKASASTGASSSSGSSSSGRAAPPAQTSPPINRGGSGGGGYGFGAGYGWGSSGGGGFGYGGGGSNGYPGPTFPVFGGFPYIPGMPGGSASSGSNSGAPPQNKYLAPNGKKKPTAPLVQKGKKISTAFKPRLQPKKVAKDVYRKPKVGPNKVNAAFSPMQRPFGRAALNLKYYSTNEGANNMGAGRLSRRGK